MPDALVAIEWTKPDGSHVSAQALTNVKGIVTFQLKGRVTGTFGLCVTDVTKAGWVYNPNQNRETCDSVTVP
jgi:hypothetical protein